MTQTDKPAEVKAHPVHSQLKLVRDHYVKVDNVLNRRKQKEEEKAPVVKRIVERTVNENKRIINQQEMEALEAKRKRFKASSTDFKDSSSSSSSSEDEESSSSSSDDKD